MIIKNIQARIYRMVYKCFNREQNATLEYEKLWLMLFSRPVISDSSQPHGPQHTRPPCSYTISWSLPKSMSLHQLYYPAISSSDALFSFCPQSFPASGTFPTTHLFTSDDQNTRASVSLSVRPVNIQGRSPLRLTGLISLLSDGLSGVFCSTPVPNYQLFVILPSFWSSSHNHTWPLGRP